MLEREQRKPSLCAYPYRKNLEGDPIINKFKRIHQIHLSGLDVMHVIHRHGMNEETSFQIEAALIDAYPGLTNIIGGVGCNEVGPMHVQEIMTLYCAETAVSLQKSLLISINRSANNKSL